MGVVTDSGDPIAYTGLPAGVPVQDRDGNVFGSVARVLQVPEEDLFDGIVVNTADGERFVDADQVAEITTTHVSCSLSSADVAALPAPSQTPVYDVKPGPSLKDRLNRLIGRDRWRREE